MLYRLDVKAFRVQNAFTTFKPKRFLNLAKLTWQPFQSNLAL